MPMPLSLTEQFTILIIGFSVFAAAILLVAYLFFLQGMEKTRLSRVSCSVLLLALAGLQLFHLRFIFAGTDLYESTLYVTLLLATPPAFYFFSREILLPERVNSPWLLVHFVPLLLSTVISPRIVTPLAFMIGTGYAIWFAYIVWGMRAQRSRFRFEMFFFSLFAILAVLVLVLGFTIPYIDPAVFYISYANFIGFALLLVVAAIIVFPEILDDIAEAASLAYASSTLNDVDVAACVSRLEELMRDDKIYQNEDLNLAMLAESMQLSTHQLSELINSHFGIGFSRYIREQRVREAQKLLLSDQRSSILSISMTTGFRSQSNFYAAFREITGEAPGNYRKRSGTTSQDS